MIAQITVRTEDLDKLLEDLRKLDPLKHTRPTDPDINTAFSDAMGVFKAWKQEISPPKEGYHKPACTTIGA